MNRHELITAIQCQHQNGPPNGYTLGWDESRYFQKFRDVALPYPAINQTSFDDSFCNTFEVCVAGERGNHHWKMTIQLSFVLPYYCVFWHEHKNVKGRDYVPASPTERQLLEQKLRKAAEQVGFTELPREWSEDLVNGVTLELSEAENVTIQKCLFVDHAG